MIRTEGPRSLYNGLVAGLQRQLCFASIRIGLYDNVKSFYTGGKDSKWLLLTHISKQIRKIVYRFQCHAVTNRNPYMTDEYPLRCSPKKQNLRGLYHSYAIAHPLPSDTQFKERKRKKNPKKFPEEGKKRNQRRSQMCTSCCMCNIDRSNSCIRTQVQKKVYHMKIWGSDSDCFNWKLRK